MWEGVFVFVAIIGIGCLWWLFTQPEAPEQFQVVLENVSSIPYEVTSRQQTFTIAPDKALILEVFSGEKILTKAKYPDGSQEDRSYTITKPITIILTHNTTPTEEGQGSQGVFFSNNSAFPVLLIERSKTGGRRWGSEIIPPRGTYQIAFVARNSTWEVVHPTAERTPIATVTVSGHAKRFLFDGHDVVVE